MIRFPTVSVCDGQHRFEDCIQHNVANVSITVSNSLIIHELDGVLGVSDVLRRFANESHLLLLDSAAEARERDARYSILTADPVAAVRLDQVHYGSEPFSTLRQWQQALPQVQTDLPFCGGIAGLMSYELGAAFEIVPQSLRDEARIPVLMAGLYDWAIVWDHLHERVHLAVLDLSGVEAARPEIRGDRLAWIHARLDREPETLPLPATAHAELRGSPLAVDPGVVSDFTREAYIAAVGRVIDYIRAGDIFQANLSQQLTARWAGSPIALYERVRQENPAPFCGLLQADDFAVVSASPERFLKVTEGHCVETRPIKGTRRRLKSPIADLYSSRELFTSEKDRAENVMIVDLLRNDLSRVCRPGSVKVTGLCEIEVFETVQHLVSTIVGELEPGKDVWDLCAAALPGGSITGAPKIRAMEIIAELEPTVRGAYCGNLFFLNPAGYFDSSILIRTFTLKDGHVQFPVGGGIVADSDPADEYAETLHKAAGMLNALNAGVPQQPH